MTTHTARESIARSNQGPTPAAQLIGLLSLAHSRFLYGPVGRAAHVNARRRETPCDCSAGCSHAAAPPHLLGRPRRHGVPEATAPPPRREAGGSPRPPPRRLRAFSDSRCAARVAWAMGSRVLLLRRMEKGWRPMSRALYPSPGSTSVAPPHELRAPRRCSPS